jgi:cytochrome P450 family 3 subfamily A
VKHPEIQEKLLKEINQFCDNEEITVELIKKITYLDLCIKETLRLWPPGTRLERKCENDIYFDGIFIPKDSIVIIPSYSVQRDSNNFENPNCFIPERFLPENVHNIKPGTYFPFGDGPRICVANRFAELALKLCVVKMVLRFKFAECDKTDVIILLASYGYLLIKLNFVSLLSALTLFQRTTIFNSERIIC